VRGNRPREGATHLLLPIADDLRAPRALLRPAVSLLDAAVLRERSGRMKVSSDPPSENMNRPAQQAAVSTLPHS
jgi:hypothetical protein